MREVLIALAILGAVAFFAASTTPVTFLGFALLFTGLALLGETWHKK
jgi:Na+/phosphate symporter